MEPLEIYINELEDKIDELERQLAEAQKALRRSPCERLMLQLDGDPFVARNCEPCTCWRAAIAANGGKDE